MVRYSAAGLVGVSDLRSGIKISVYCKYRLTNHYCMPIAHGEQEVKWNSINGPLSTQESIIQAFQASIQALTLQVQSLSLKTNTTPRTDKSHTANDNCKGLGHTLDECWKLGGGRQDQYLSGGRESEMHMFLVS